MDRPLRIEYAGALYHLTARGNERKSKKHGCQAYTVHSLCLSIQMSQPRLAPDKRVKATFTATGVTVNRGADFVKHLVPSRRVRQYKELDPTALAGWEQASLLPSGELAGQRRD